MVATEAQTEEMIGAGLPRAQHAAGASDRRQVEILGLTGAHPDLVPQGVVDHGVALLAERDGKALITFYLNQWHLSSSVKEDLFECVFW